MTLTIHGSTLAALLKAALPRKSHHLNCIVWSGDSLYATDGTVHACVEVPNAVGPSSPKYLDGSVLRGLKLRADHKFTLSMTDNDSVEALIELGAVNPPRAVIVDQVNPDVAQKFPSFRIITGAEQFVPNENEAIRLRDKVLNKIAALGDARGTQASNDGALDELTNDLETIVQGAIAVFGSGLIDWRKRFADYVATITDERPKRIGEVVVQLMNDVDERLDDARDGNCPACESWECDGIKSHPDLAEAIATLEPGLSAGCRSLTTPPDIAQAVRALYKFADINVMV